MTEETVNIMITCEQKVRYAKTVTMSRKRWEDIKKIPDREMENECTSPLSEFIDDHDIQDCDDYEDIEMVVVDENDDPVEPEDYYNGGEDIE